MKDKLIVGAFLSWLGMLNFHLTAAAQPVATTLAATSIGQTNATLNGTVNPNGSIASAYFQYGLTTNYDNLGGFRALPATNTTQTLPGLVVNSLRGPAGANWTPTSAPSTNWESIASSADGSRLAAAVYAGGVYISTNFGDTWTKTSVPDATAQSFAFPAVASSSDGLRLAAVAGGGIYTSTSGGTTWTQTFTLAGSWSCIVSSADGSRLAAGLFGGGIWTSTNFGATWTASSAPTDNWQTMASSADGMRLAAGTINTGIYASTNGGLTWTQTSAPQPVWKFIASSADGMRLTAAAGSFIYTSTDGGGTWTQTDVPFGPFWQTVASSADGTRLAAGASSAISTSTDGGNTWTQADAPTHNWQAIASSADGTQLAAVIYGGGGIYTSSGPAISLKPGTLYHYRAVGLNTAGTSLGNDMTFTTAAGAPTAATLAASGISATNATLNGTLTTGGLTTSAYFRYGLTTNYSSYSATNTLAATNVAVSAANLIGSLTPGTIYHFQLVVSNSSGTATGSDVSFSTSAAPPTVTTLAATSITATNATLNGSVNPNGAATSADFRYGLTTNYGSYSSTNTLPATNVTLSVSNLIGSLSPGTIYHFQLVAGNSAGTSLGNDLTFTTSPGAPTATTLPASGATATDATLNGTLTTGGLTTSAYFRYGLTTNYSSYSATNTLAATNVAVFAANLIGSLTPGTIYHFQLVVSNSSGTATGGDVSFSTLAAPPTVTTLAATSITATNATLNGSVNPNGAATSADFRCGLTTNYGSYSPTNTLPASNVTLSVSNLLGGLSPGTIHHFQLVAGNSAGTSLGNDLTFTTSPGAPTATTLAASGATATNATLNGTLTTGNLTTSAYFRYGLTTNYGSYTTTNTLAATNVAVSAANLIGSLTPGTIYHFQLVGSNSSGTATGGDVSFSTLAAAPTVTTLAATSITATNATLNGSVSPNGDFTLAYFEYGPTANYGSLGGATVLPATNITLTVPGLAVNSLRGAAGADWMATGAPVTNWQSIAASADGSRLAAVVYGGGIYTSTNSGVTWTPTSAPSDNWQSIVSSANGMQLTAAVIGAGIYTSTNGGSTWTQTSAPNRSWVAIAASADGSRLAAAVYGGGIYTSTNSGLTWTPASVGPGGHFWTCLASSADGLRLAAASSDRFVFVSTDGGLTWTQSSAPGVRYYSIASSADGARLAAVVDSGGIYASTNAGVNWTPASVSNASWSSIASSADGTRLAAVINGGGIHISTNGGVNWTPASVSNASWSSIAFSADGTRLVAAVKGGGIYTSTGPTNSLAPGTTYHYRLVGYNRVGTSFGSDLTFTTSPLAPLVSTLAASDILGNSATLNGAVNPNGAATTAYFRYGLTTNYGSFSATNSLPATNALLLLSDLISSLSPLTTYHYQLVSGNSVGTSLGADRTFTTGSGAPQVTTLSASGVAGNSATLYGTVNPNGTATTAYFQYGLTTNYGSYSATNSLPATNSTLSVSTLINGLSPDTYHFRLVAINSGGTAFGADQILGNFPHAFTGAAPGQGLDLQGTFVYAVNVGSNAAAGLVSDANFTADNAPGVTITAPGNTLNTVIAWANPNFGATTDAVHLAQAMSSIRWTSVPGVLTVNLAGLQAGRSYQLQLLFIESCCDRAFDVKVNGTAIVPNFRLLDYGPMGTAIVIPYSFTATNTNALIQLGGGTGGSENNPTLSAFTLELLPGSPQPQPFNLIGTIQSPGGAFQLKFTNLSGLGFTVLGATNAELPLSNWTVLGVPSEAPPGQYQFTDSQTTNNPRRFYRVRSP